MGLGRLVKKAIKYSPIGLSAKMAGIDLAGGQRGTSSGSAPPSFTPKSFEYNAPALSDIEDVQSGGQSSRRLLTGTIEEAKRRARLTGRSLSPGEVEGLTRGHFAGAESRLTARKGLALAKRGQEISARGQDIQGGLGYAGLESGERMKKADFDLGLFQTQEQIRAAGEAQKSAKGSGIGTLVGGGLGFALGGPVGAGVGAGVGSALGGDICIIITACTNPNSAEVNITRRYRDKIMLPETLRGYYMIAEKVVPLIHKSDKFKHFLKKHLVDSLVSTCEWKLGETNTVPSWKARIITGLFLGGCNILGNTKPQFVRSNGEVF